MQAKTGKKAVRTRKSKNKVNWLFCLLAAVITLYVVFMIVEQHIQINNARTELAQLEDNIFTQEQTNAELKKVADAVQNNDEEAFAGYVEKIAREDLDYVKNGEVVYVNIAGD